MKFDYGSEKLKYSFIDFKILDNNCIIEEKVKIKDFCFFLK